MKKWLIVGLPPWATTSRWDFNAKVSEGDLKLLQSLTREQRSRMLQTILLQEFGLRYHFEDKVQPGYELSVLPGGPKFKSTPAPGGDLSRRRAGNWTFYPGTAKANGITMMQFANSFSPLVERVVIDKTGLTDMYDLELNWTPEDSPDADTDGAPGVFTALREQLGLKLAPAKAPVPSLVIDAMTPPEAN